MQGSGEKMIQGSLEGHLNEKRQPRRAAFFLPEIPNLLPKTLPNGRSLKKTCYKSGTYMVRTKRLELLQLAPLEPKS
jgi:hypothetical protein